MGIFKRLLQQYQKSKDPVKYWRCAGAKIGEGCEIYSSASFGSEPYLIRIGNHVRINSGVQMVTHDGGVWVLRGLKEENRDVDMFGPITIGNNVHIATNAMIMPGVSIGDNCIIGCGAIVTKSIPSNSIAVGIPARVIERVEEYEAKHAQDLEHTKTLSPEEKRKYLLEKYEDVLR